MSSQPGPVLALWTPTTQVVRNGDQTLTATVWAGPVQAPDPASDTGWSPIDTSLTATADGYEPGLTDASVQLSDGSDSAPLATVEQDGTSLSVGLAGDVPAPTIQGDTATYGDVMTGVDATVQAKADGFEVSYVVDEASHAPQVLDIPLSLDGLCASLTTTGALVLTDGTGTVVGGADPALMWGSATDPAGDPTVVTPVATSLVQGADGTILRLTPDPSFFTTPGVTYPVVIDPTVSLSMLLDTSVDSANPTTSYGTATTLRSGRWATGGTFRTYIGFDRAGIAGTHVLSASLTLHETGSASCTATQIDLLSVSSGPSPPYTWNSQPTVGSIYAKATEAKGFSGSCAAGDITVSTGGDSSHTLTDLVQAWADGTSPRRSSVCGPTTRTPPTPGRSSPPPTRARTARC